MKKNIIRAGDYVRVRPGARLVLRVGYPKTTEDYLPKAMEMVTKMYEEAGIHMGSWEPDAVVWAVARKLGFAEHFGGMTRMIHFSKSPTPEVTVFCVKEVVTRKTGKKNQGAGPLYDSWSGDWDDNPSTFTTDRTLRIAVPGWYGKLHAISGLGYLVEDLEKLTPENFLHVSQGRLFPG